MVGSMANLVERVSETVRSMGVKAVYGDKVTVGGVEILPVALVYFGFGAGSDESGEAGGGGGGGASIPIGAYISGRSGPTFTPNPVTFMVVAIPFVFVAGRALARVIRVMKK